MKSKKWLLITVISIVLIAASLVLLFVWVLPTMNTNKALKALAEGDTDSAQTLFAEMTPEKRESLKDDVKDIVVYTANQYIDGQKSYGDMYKVMRTVEYIAEYEGFSADAFTRINIPKAVEVYEAAITLYGENGDSSEYKDKEKEFLQFRNVEYDGGFGLMPYWSSVQRDTFEEKCIAALDAKLKEKYDAYAEEKMSYEDMKAASEVANDLWYSDYSYGISNDLYYDDYFRRKLEDYQKEYDEKEYFDVIDDIAYTRESYSDEAAWFRWEHKFNELFNNATETAKTYYVQQAIDYANNGDQWNAEYLRDKLTERFGDAVDISPITAAIEENSHADWQKAYVEFMYDWQNNLANDMAVFSSYTAQLYDPEAVTMADIDARYITLYDIDKNGIPEMFLRGTEYVAVYSFDGNKPVYTGYLSPMGLGETGEMIVGAQQEVNGTTITCEALVEFDDDYYTWYLEKTVAYAQVDGQYVYVKMTNEGEAVQVSEDEFKEGQSEIEGRMNGSLPIGVEMSKAEEYIYGFTN